MKFTFIMLAVLCLFTFSCANLEQNYPERNFYVIHAERTDKTSDRVTGGILEINNFNISPEFTSREFVYRTGENKYVSDFYNQFFKSPASLIRNETYQWMSDSGMFKSVISRSVEIDTDYILDGNVTELYIDLINLGNPRAVLSIQFFITKETPTKTVLIFDKKYREEIDTQDRSPENFIKSWNNALELILTDFEKDMSSLNL